jgi:hypothetical protein
MYGIHFITHRQRGFVLVSKNRLSGSGHAFWGRIPEGQFAANKDCTYSRSATFRIRWRPDNSITGRERFFVIGLKRPCADGHGLLGEKISNTLIVEGNIRMDKHYLTILAREFRAGEGSFLLQLRIDMYWDKDAFGHLTEAMRACCKDYQYSQEHLERDLQEQEQLTQEQMEDEQFADEYYLHKNEDDTMLPRWLADGFWYLSTFVRDHTSHPAWEQTIACEPEYFSHAYTRLDDLASWFFSGCCPWIDEEKGWTYKSI